MKRVISFDGGGVRGIISATWVSMLEHELGKPLITYADILAGTSTGSIIALGLGCGLSGDDLVDLYFQYSPTIFPNFFSCFLSKVKRIPAQGISSPLYDETGISSTLKENLGDLQLKDLPVRTIVPTYCLASGKPYIIDSENIAHVKLPCWQVAKASSAAPAYFPAEVLEVEGKRLLLVDGGLCFNNPSVLAADLLQDKEKVKPAILSFGTGQASTVTNENFAKTAGLLDWGTKLISTMLDANVDSTDHYALAMDYQYDRLQTTLAHYDYAIDNSRQNNLKRLHHIAKTKNREIQDIAQKLKAEKHHD